LDESLRVSSEKFSQDRETFSLRHLRDNSSQPSVFGRAFRFQPIDGLLPTASCILTEAGCEAEACPTEKFSGTTSCFLLSKDTNEGSSQDPSSTSIRYKKEVNEAVPSWVKVRPVDSSRLILSQNTSLLFNYSYPSLQAPSPTMTTRPSRKSPSSLLSATKASSARIRSSARLKAMTTNVDADEPTSTRDAGASKTPTLEDIGINKPAGDSNAASHLDHSLDMAEFEDALPGVVDVTGGADDTSKATEVAVAGTVAKTVTGATAGSTTTGAAGPKMPPESNSETKTASTGTKADSSSSKLEEAAGTVAGTIVPNFTNPATTTTTVAGSTKMTVDLTAGNKAPYATSASGVAACNDTGVDTSTGSPASTDTSPPPQEFVQHLRRQDAL